LALAGGVRKIDIFNLNDNFAMASTNGFLLYFHRVGVATVHILDIIGEERMSPLNTHLLRERLDDLHESPKLPRIDHDAYHPLQIL